METTENKENTETAENKKSRFEARVAKAKSILLGTLIATSTIFAATIGIGAGSLHQKRNIENLEHIIGLQNELLEFQLNRNDGKGIDQKNLIIRKFLENEAARLDMSPELTKAVIDDIQSDIDYALSIGDSEQLAEALDRDAELNGGEKLVQRGKDAEQKDLDLKKKAALIRTDSLRKDYQLRFQDTLAIPGNQPKEEVQRIPGNQPRKVVQSIPASKDFER